MTDREALLRAIADAKDDKEIAYVLCRWLDGRKGVIAHLDLTNIVDKAIHDALARLNLTEDEAIRRLQSQSIPPPT